jgi:hypothetical protein
MITFLLTAIVMSALTFSGYRLNMYLYTRGAVGGSSSSAQSVAMDGFSVRPVRDVEMEERDYGLRYARIGLLIIASFLVILVVGLVAAIFAVV